MGDAVQLVSHDAVDSARDERRKRRTRRKRKSRKRERLIHNLAWLGGGLALGLPLLAALLFAMSRY